MMQNYSLAVFLLHDKARGMLGIFEADDGDKPTAKREFFKTLDPSIKEGDLVAVETGTRHRVSVVKIVKADAPPSFTSSEQARWIITKIDVSSYEKLKAFEDEAVAAVKEAELKKERHDLKKTMLGDFGDTLNNLPIITQVHVNGDVKLLDAAPKAETPTPVPPTV